MKLIVKVLVLVLVQAINCQQQKENRISSQANFLPQKDEEIKYYHPHHRCGGPSHVRCPHHYHCRKYSHHVHSWGHCVRKNC